METNNKEVLYAVRPQDIDEFGEEKQAQGFKQGIFVAVTTMVALKYIPKFNKWYKNKKKNKQLEDDVKVDIERALKSGEKFTISAKDVAPGTVAYVKPLEDD